MYLFKINLIINIENLQFPFRNIALGILKDKDRHKEENLKQIMILKILYEYE